MAYKTTYGNVVATLRSLANEYQDMMIKGVLRSDDPVSRLWSLRQDADCTITIQSNRRCPNCDMDLEGWL